MSPLERLKSLDSKDAGTGGGGGGAEGTCPSDFDEVLTFALRRCVDKNELKGALARLPLENFLRPC